MSVWGWLGVKAPSLLSSRVSSADGQTMPLHEEQLPQTPDGADLC